MKELKDFIKDCTDSWHTTEKIANILEGQGFEKLEEGEKWTLKKGHKYFVVRNMSSIIAFKMPTRNIEAYMITAAHGESPTFKIKAIPEMIDNNYVRLNTEIYGGPMLPTWLDRPLSVSGRVAIKERDAIEMRLVKMDRDALIIPSLAPHLDRTSRDGLKLDMVQDMPPMYALCGDKETFLDEIAALAETTKEKIKGFDLMLYNREEGRVWGKNNEFISAPRLDDLQCVYALLQGFLEGDCEETAQVYCVFDNEEVGSGTMQGAKSDFLSSVLLRISESEGIGYSEHMQKLSSSFMVSADNGHAVHPNRRETSDCENYPKIGKGVVIKYNASQRYTTNAVSEAIFKQICEMADVPYQVYANKSDIAGGSTLGNLAAEKTCIQAVDVGLAQLSMHSAYETAGAYDTEYMAKAIKKFYGCRIVRRGEKYYIK